MTTIPEIKAIHDLFTADLSQASTTADLYTLKTLYLGKKGKVSDCMKKMGDLSPDQRSTYGKEVNVLKDHFQVQINAKKEHQCKRLVECFK